MEIFCVKCKSKTPTGDVTTTTTKNGRLARTGTCTICGTKKFKFIRDSEGTPDGFSLKKRTRNTPRSGGDITSTINKLPGWGTYPGEKHLPGYNYCGPGTRLDIRLDQQDRPKHGEAPINSIDTACYHHDLAYRDNNLKQRHIADVKLLHALDSISDLAFKEKLARWIIKGAMKGKLLLGGQV